MAGVTASQMNELQKQQNEITVRNFNRGLGQGKGLQQNMGKESFLRILTEQLKNQDPLKPQDDKAFIAQLAQFNSLEQMLELNRGFAELSERFAAGQALDLLGREVTINSGLDRNGEPILVSGLVSAVAGGDSGGRITVEGQQYSAELVIRVAEAK